METGKGSFLKQLREIVLDMTDGEELIDTPTGRYTGITKPSSEQVMILQELVFLIMKTRATRDETKIYLSNKGMTYSGVCDELRFRKKRESNPNTIQSRVYLDKEKITQALGDDIIDVIKSGNKKAIKKKTELVEKMINENEEESLLESLGLNIKILPGVKSDLTDEEFDGLIDIIAPYTEIYRKCAAEGISEKAIRYVRYIETHTLLDDLDRERLHRLREITRPVR